MFTSEKKRRKKFVHEVCRIGIRDLKLKGVLNMGGYCYLYPQIGHKDTCKIKVFVTQDRVKVNYDFRDSPAGPQAKEQLLRLTSTPCNYGGDRRWFFCPSCRKRAGVLYKNTNYSFACRKCCRLSYKSQNVTDFERQCIRVRRLQKKLDSVSMLDPAFEKPKGMHQNTYVRLQMKIEEEQENLFEC